VPESAEKSAERKRRVREAGRRREAVSALRLGSAVCDYTARQLSNGLTPEQAQEAAMEAAAELAALALALRKMTRPGGPAERRRQARRLRSLGMTGRQIASALGVSERVTYVYLKDRRGSLR
jgi:hypothetical protein